MADEELLKILQRGVLAWNKWRKENPSEHIELGGPDLWAAAGADGNND